MSHPPKQCAVGVGQIIGSLPGPVGSTAITCDTRRWVVGLAMWGNKSVPVEREQSRTLWGWFSLMWAVAESSNLKLIKFRLYIRFDDLFNNRRFHSCFNLSPPLSLSDFPRNLIQNKLSLIVTKKTGGIVNQV